MSTAPNPRPDAGRHPRVIAMLNQKGGVGKTTSAVNLGAALAQRGCRVCMIDLDPQAHLTLHLGIESDRIDRTVYDVLIDPECRAANALVREARPGLDAILAEVDLAGAESELATAPDRQTRLTTKFGEIASDYDVVLIDCPPSLGLLTMNALTLATEIFVPMQAHFLALQGVGRLLETVGLVCGSVNPALRVTGILLCMHEGQTTLAREIVTDLDAFFTDARSQEVPWRDCRVLRPPIRRNIKLAEAPSFGQTIFDYAPWCHGALDYRKLASSLCDGWGLGPATAPRTPRTVAARTPSTASTATAATTANATPTSNTAGTAANTATPTASESKTSAAETKSAGATPPRSASTVEPKPGAGRAHAAVETAPAPADSHAPANVPASGGA